MATSFTTRIPLWQHDCEECVYCGTLDNRVDVYRCEGLNMPELVLRTSSEPSDYRSLPMNIAHSVSDPLYQTALRMVA